jgi:23S rRNA G2069 N7-methylase RlmK/C1962 C5-methylase RlmI
MNEYAKRYRIENPEVFKRAKQKYRAKHIEKIRPKEAAQSRERRKERQEIIAGRPRPDLCEICGELHFRIVFDHCHASGFFRGWLCDRCNRTLGMVKDSVELLRTLAQYVEDARNAHKG